MLPSCGRSRAYPAAGGNEKGKDKEKGETLEGGLKQFAAAVGDFVS